MLSTTGNIIHVPPTKSGPENTKKSNAGNQNISTLRVSLVDARKILESKRHFLESTLLMAYTSQLYPLLFPIQNIQEKLREKLKKSYLKAIFLSTQKSLENQIGLKLLVSAICRCRKRAIPEFKNNHTNTLSINSTQQSIKPLISSSHLRVSRSQSVLIDTLYPLSKHLECDSR
ncbi:hypothetical protein WN55_06027 [Dufourea novaeangliae]|uniref:Uncharacterized protein n=1 Tax=Dufourea novaeangliae TaxID=178035 RepID=A0A154PR34_DUFNO|nr:hypothetical protein WN55_06027 [Dufourea novaeangliae]